MQRILGLMRLERKKHQKLSTQVFGIKQMLAEIQGHYIPIDKKYTRHEGFTVVVIARIISSQRTPREPMEGSVRS